MEKQQHLFLCRKFAFSCDVDNCSIIIFDEHEMKFYVEDEHKMKFHVEEKLFYKENIYPCYLNCFKLLNFVGSSNSRGGNHDVNAT